jgi:hypothetical protein
MTAGSLSVADHVGDRARPERVHVLVRSRSPGSRVALVVISRASTRIVARSIELGRF